MSKMSKMINKNSRIRTVRGQNHHHDYSGSLFYVRKGGGEQVGELLELVAGGPLRRIKGANGPTSEMLADFFKKREKCGKDLPSAEAFCEYPNHSFYDCIPGKDGQKAYPIELLEARHAREPIIIYRPLSQYMSSDDSLRDSQNQKDSSSKLINSQHTLNIDPLQSGLFYVYGSSGSGKTRLIYETAAAHRLTVIHIQPEDYMHNKQLFSTTLSKLCGGRTRVDYFERRRPSKEIFLVLIDELEVALETENGAFIYALCGFIENLGFGVSIAITSTRTNIIALIFSIVPISCFPELSKTSLLKFVHCLDREDVGAIRQTIEQSYSIRFGRRLDEFDFHHLYLKERANKEFLQSVAAGKRKCEDRGVRQLPSIYSDISPMTRDNLLCLFEQRMRRR